MSVSINPPKTPVTAGSSGIAAATLPNVCKMPGPPAPFVPTPLPNIGKSDNSPQGYSTTVTIGGKAVALAGASFNSTGDVASQGTGGGLISSNVQGMTTFIGPGSMDVKIEGKNVQLLGDQMLNNGAAGSGSPANAATMGGVLQAPGMPVIDVPSQLRSIAEVCNRDENAKAGYVDPSKPTGPVCTKLGVAKHTCCKNKINEMKGKGEMPSNVNAEKPFTKGGFPAKYPGEIRPDVVIENPAGGFSAVYDFKFNCSSNPRPNKRQFSSYFRAFKAPTTMIHYY